MLEKENPESKFERANVHLTRETLTSLGTILVKMVLHQVSKRWNKSTIHLNQRIFGYSEAFKVWRTIYHRLFLILLPWQRKTSYGHRNTIKRALLSWVKKLLWALVPYLEPCKDTAGIEDASPFRSALGYVKGNAKRWGKKSTTVHSSKILTKFQ